MYLFRTKFCLNFEFKTIYEINCSFFVHNLIFRPFIKRGGHASIREVDASHHLLGET